MSAERVAAVGRLQEKLMDVRLWATAKVQMLEDGEYAPNRIAVIDIAHTMARYDHEIGTITGEILQVQDEVEGNEDERV